MDKKKRGRPKVFSNEEIKNHKTKYMVNKEWYCDVCKNERNYTLAGKWMHCKSKKHIKKAEK